MALTDPALPPEERKATLRAIATGLSPLHPRFYNEIATEWNEIAEQLGEPQVLLIDLPGDRLHVVPDPPADSSRLDEIIRQAIRQET